MKAAAISLSRLRNKVKRLGSKIGTVDQQFKLKFLEAINNDLNTARALSFAWEVLKSDLNPETKLATIKDFDLVLGLKLTT